jgi:hypothetical protein
VTTISLLVRRAGTTAGVASLRLERGFAEAARVFGITAFVVAAPLLDVLGANPTFFVAHDIDGTRLALFALALVVIPPLIPIFVLSIARLVAPRASPMVSSVVIGGLVGLALVPTLNRRTNLSTVAFISLLLLVGVAAGVGYRQWKTVRTYLTFLAPAPLLFLVIFLFASPASTLIGESEPAAVAAALHGTRTPVIVVAFDELPLGVLLDERGEIAEQRYPGFARLAAMSTWYPRATTVAPWTHLAIPAILTGRTPTDPVPVAATHPQSLFTLLGRSHELHDHEAVTRLCPKDLCGAPPSKDAALLEDSAIVYLHSLLPDDYAQRWLPPINDRWSDFAGTEAPTPEPTTTDLSYDAYSVLELYTLNSSDEVGRYADFLRSLEPTGERPGAWFAHTLLPHLPYHLLADGRQYNGGPLAGLGPAETLPDDAGLQAIAAQRLAIQTAFVDQLVSGLLDRLEQESMLDDALVVVTADHGVTFAGGRNVRGGSAQAPSVSDPLDERVRDDVLPVPLFIKYPGQSSAKTDNTEAHTTDVLPTIVDALDISLPSDWSFDGTSLLGHAARGDKVKFIADTHGEQSIPLLKNADAHRMAALINSTLGEDGDDRDLYRIAPYGALVGEDAAPLVDGPRVGTAQLADPGAYANVVPLGVVPSLFSANVDGLGVDDWVAIALNGKVAGTGPVYEEGGRLRVTAMLDPSLLQPGPNAVAVYRVSADGQSLQPIG